MMLFSRRNVILAEHSYCSFIKFAHVRRKSYSSLEYCINLVRTFDKENYFCTLLLPQSIRSAAIAIRAFNVEIASIQDQVSQANLGVMRMKFWEDSVDKIYRGKVPNNPVAVELAKAVQKHKLSKSHIQRLLSSRAKRLGQTSFSTAREMEDYADDSCSTIHLLILQATGRKSIHLEHAALHAGKAQGIVNLLRGIPHCVSRRVLSLPSDLLAHHGVSEESVFRGTHSEDNLREVVYDIAGRAYIHLLKTREYQDEVPADIRCLFLPVIPADRYLKNLRLANFDVFDGGLQKKNPFLPLLLYWNSILKSY